MDNGFDVKFDGDSGESFFDSFSTPPQDPPQEVQVQPQDQQQDQQDQDQVQDQDQQLEDTQQQIEQLSIKSPEPVGDDISNVETLTLPSDNSNNSNNSDSSNNDGDSNSNGGSVVQQQLQNNDIDNSVVDSMTITSANSSQIDNSDVSVGTGESIGSLSTTIISEEIPLASADSSSKDGLTFLQENSVSPVFDFNSSQNSNPLVDEQFSTPPSTLPAAVVSSPSDQPQAQEQAQAQAQEQEQEQSQFLQANNSSFTSQSSEKDCSSFFGDSNSGGNDDFSSFFSKPAEQPVAAPAPVPVQQQPVAAQPFAAAPAPAPSQQPAAPAQPEKELSSFFGGDSGVGGGGGNNFFGGGGDDFGSSFFDKLIIQQEEEQRRKEQQEIQKKHEEAQRKIQEEQQKQYMLQQQQQQQQQNQWNGYNQYNTPQQQYNNYYQQPQQQQPQNQWNGQQYSHSQSNFYDQYQQTPMNHYNQYQQPSPPVTQYQQPAQPAVAQYQPQPPVSQYPSASQYQQPSPPPATNQYQAAPPPVASHSISPPPTQQYNSVQPQRSVEQVPYYQPTSPVASHSYTAQPPVSAPIPTHPHIQQLTATPPHSPSSSYIKPQSVTMPVTVPTSTPTPPPAVHQYQPSPSSSVGLSNSYNNSVPTASVNTSNPGSVTSAASLNQPAGGVPSYQSHARTHSNEFSAMLKQQVGYTPTSPAPTHQITNPNSLQTSAPQLHQSVGSINGSIPHSPSSSYTASVPMAMPVASAPNALNMSGSYSQSPSQYQMPMQPMQMQPPQQNYYQQQQPQANQYNQQFPQQPNQYYQQQTWGSTPAVQKTDTPLFTRPHPVFTFGFGGKVALLRPIPQVKTTAIQTIGIKSLIGQSQLYHNVSTFPGPLGSGTSKDTVNKWIQERIADIGSGRMDNLCSRDPEASHLLWELLMVLNNNEGQILDNEKNFDKTLQKLLLDNKSNMTNFPTQQQLGRSDSDMQILLNEMQNLLVRGDLIGAHKFTMENQLWTHAIVLSHYLGPDVYSRTLLAFSSTSFPLGSPLKTVYSLYSNSTRELFKDLQGASASPAFLESWKENIAALLFNGKAQGQKVIGEMGDRIWAIQRRVEAAHVCYLLSDYQFGPLDNPNSRIVLLGGDHKVTKNYITTESLQRSEIYEYGKTLGNSQYSLPMILVYKFLYATLLCDLGMIEQSIKYINTIKNTLKNHNLNNPNFVYQLDTFSERLMNFSTSKMNTSGSWIQLPSIFKFGFGGSKKNSLTPSSAPVAVAAAAPAPVPVAAPVVASPVPPARDSPKQVSRSSSLKFDDDEDLYSSFSTKTPKKDMSQPPVPPPESDAGNLDAAAPTPQDDDRGQAGGKSWWFWKKNKSNAKEMKLKDENEFIYDEKLGTWIEKGKPLPKPAEPTPPPPMMDGHSPSATHTPGTSSPPIPHSSPRAGEVGDDSSPLSPGVNKYSLISPNPGGKRRPRYLDTFNQSVYSGSTNNLVSSTDGSNNSSFKSAMPVPGQFESATPAPIPADQQSMSQQPPMSMMGGAPPMGAQPTMPMMSSPPMGAPPMMGSMPMSMPMPMGGGPPMMSSPPMGAPPMMSSPPMGAPPMAGSMPNFPPQN